MPCPGYGLGCSGQGWSWGGGQEELNEGKDFLEREGICHSGQDTCIPYQSTGVRILTPLLSPASCSCVQQEAASGDPCHLRGIPSLAPRSWLGPDPALVVGSSYESEPVDLSSLSLSLPFKFTNINMYLKLIQGCRGPH